MRKTVAIIGAGKVGRSLGRALALSGSFEISSACNRTAARADESVRFIGAGMPATDPVVAAGEAGLVLVTTSDSAIKLVCDAIASRGGFRKGAVVLHVSGALTAEVLAGARKCAAHIGSFHPLQTFPEAAVDPRSFEGVTCVYEGDARAESAVRAIVSALNGVAVHIEADEKPLYHAASVLACNCMVALIDAALEAFDAAGIPRKSAMTGVMPLVARTVENIGRIGTVAALTGPVARGDVQTVVRNVEAIRKRVPHLAGMFAELGLRAVEVALRKAAISQETALELRRVLGEKR
ncbi:MAG: DUF2520 domain-containing protein [Planctomycetota bacterium]|nr:DUF2520 domain-containing protein [Planctomycetota bacterium]